VSQSNSYDVAISAQPIDSAEVTQAELQLISAFFPEILKEMMQHIDDEE
jgi:hypothetical protein